VLSPPVRQPVASRTDVFERRDTARYGSEDAPLHDPCVIAHLLQPALFHARHIPAQIGTKGEHTPGTTVADGYRVSVRAPYAVVMGGVDREGFRRLLTERLGGVRTIDECNALTAASQ
jgi:purine nucleosidase